jgi:hypothetical protein
MLFLEACKKVRNMTESELEKTLKEASNLKGVQERALDICYDRAECLMLGIPYENITNKNFLKAKAAAYYTLHDEGELNEL